MSNQKTQVASVLGTVNYLQHHLDKTLKKYGSYQFIDKGPEELMDNWGEILTQIKKLSKDDIDLTLNSLEPLKKDGTSVRMVESIKISLGIDISEDFQKGNGIEVKAMTALDFFNSLIK